MSLGISPGGDVDDYRLVLGRRLKNFILVAVVHIYCCGYLLLKLIVHNGSRPII